MDFFREQREHTIFRALLNMVPNLEERIMNGSQEEVKLVADLVGPSSCLFDAFPKYAVRDSFRKEPRALGQMIQRV